MSNTGSGLATSFVTVNMLGRVTSGSFEFRGARIYTLLTNSRRTNLENSITCTGERGRSLSSIRAVFVTVSAVHRVRRLRVCAGNYANARGGSGTISRVVCRTNMGYNIRVPRARLCPNTVSTRNFDECNLVTSNFYNIGRSPGACCRAHLSAPSGVDRRYVGLSLSVYLRTTGLCSRGNNLSTFERRNGGHFGENRGGWVSSLKGYLVVGGTTINGATTFLSPVFHDYHLLHPWGKR